MWKKVCTINDIPENGGACVIDNNQQIAIFKIGAGEKWYAVENQCPHKQQMVISRGIIGDSQGVPKVACPLHKHTFSLEDGNCLSAENLPNLKTFPVKQENEVVYIKLKK